MLTTIENRDYSNENFSDIEVMPEKLGRVRFTDCRFNSLSFLDTVLDGTVFENCSFDFTRIGGKLNHCAFLNCSFRYANLLGAEFDGCKMTGSNLAELTNPGYLISGGDWSYTEIAKLAIKKHDLGSVNFTGANLFECRFEGCRLGGVRFDNAVVNRMSLKNSDIAGTSFAFVNMGQIDFKGCTADLDFAVAFTRAHGIKV
ncbi:MAG: pentapeptide repeat-containing protein [Clostridiales bacterium]|nr:pentapeptide repeat-containing protein [Clostridiales bacterium]